MIFWTFVFALSESKMSDTNDLHIVVMVSIIPLH